MLSLLFLFSSCCLLFPAMDHELEQALASAGVNRPALEYAIQQAPPDQKPGMLWLIKHMPVEDRMQLTTQYLVDNVNASYVAWYGAPWKDSIPEEIFYDSVLPYASINERRDNWREMFHSRFMPLVKNANTASEAAAILNNKIYSILDVRYSTDRPKPDQSPFESIDARTASCTGLSILLVNACRSVGVPARFVGAPMWSDESGNHSWVEIYDNGQWHFTGAAEPAGMELDKAWFQGRARGAIEGHETKAILAVTWRKVPLTFPLPWKPQDDTVRAVDVTRRYTGQAAAVEVGMARVRFRILDKNGSRLSLPIILRTENGDIMKQGRTRDERFDSNDHLEFMLPVGSSCQIEIEGIDYDPIQVTQDEQLITIRMKNSPIRPEDQS